VGPHPHDLYLAPLALGDMCYDDLLPVRLLRRPPPSPCLATMGRSAIFATTIRFSAYFFPAFGFSTGCGTRFGFAAMALRMTT
jgi:hypothetical protein